MLQQVIEKQKFIVALHKFPYMAIMLRAVFHVIIYKALVCVGYDPILRPYSAPIGFWKSLQYFQHFKIIYLRVVFSESFSVSCIISPDDPLADVQRPAAPHVLIYSFHLFIRRLLWVLVDEFH